MARLTATRRQKAAFDEWRNLQAEPSGTSPKPVAQAVAPNDIRVTPFSGYEIRCNKCGEAEVRKSKQLADMRAEVCRRKHVCPKR
jgi:hypothetical protein